MEKINKMEFLKIKRYLNWLFYIGIFLSFIIPFTFFKAFNTLDFIEIPKPNAEMDTLIYHLDECKLKNEKIIVSGWASPISSRGQNLVYARTDKGSISLRTSPQYRGDVSTAMQKPGMYDRSGYSASIKLPKDIKLLSIVIVTKIEEKIYIVEANCGK